LLPNNLVSLENVLEANELWNKVLDVLQIEIHSLGFDVWIKPMKALGIIQNKLVLEVPTDGHREEIEARYSRLILSAISKICESRKDIPQETSAGEAC
ncbi:MAG: hypothetical protein K2O94_00360, partial [Clostridiales bacterium]|nr:hypothetical protein [Clostridiales bacterium]